jgi:hypothetical protein
MEANSECHGTSCYQGEFTTKCITMLKFTTNKCFNFYRNGKATQRMEALTERRGTSWYRGEFTMKCI